MPTDTVAAILLGIVEGVTEFLPVSSTGHLILATRLLGFDADRWATFNVVIQLGAILAVAIVYWRTIWAVASGLVRGEGGAWRFVRNLLAAFVPFAVLGLALHKRIEALLGNAEVVAVALVVGGIAILTIERVARPGSIRGIADMPLKTAAGVGLIQCCALVPGVSRSGATILGAVLLGVERRTAAEFSFFLAIPTMLGATAVALTKHHDGVATVGGATTLIGSAVAFVVALAVVRGFVTFVGRHGFAAFGWYRIAVGIAALIALSR